MQPKKMNFSDLSAMANHVYITTRKDPLTLVHHYDVPTTIRDRKEVKYPTAASADVAFQRHQSQDTIAIGSAILDISKVTAVVITPDSVNVMFSLKNQRKLFNFYDKVTGRGTWIAYAHERKIRIVDNSERILYITFLINDTIMQVTEHTMFGMKSSIHDQKAYNDVMAKRMPKHFIAELVSDGSAIVINAEAVVMLLNDSAGINVVFGNRIMLCVHADPGELRKCSAPMF